MKKGAGILNRSLSPLPSCIWNEDEFSNMSKFSSGLGEKRQKRGGRAGGCSWGNWVMYVSSCLCSLRSPSSCEHLPGETVSSRNPRPIFQSLASLRLSLGLKDLHYAFHGVSGKEPTFQCRRCKRRGFDPWVEKIPWRRAWQLTPVFLPGESHGQRGLAGYGPLGRKGSYMTEATQHARQANYFIWCSTEVKAISSRPGGEMPLLNGLMSPSSFSGGVIQHCADGGLHASSRILGFYIISMVHVDHRS